MIWLSANLDLFMQIVFQGEVYFCVLGLIEEDGRVFPTRFIGWIGSEKLPWTLNNRFQQKAGSRVCSLDLLSRLLLCKLGCWFKVKKMLCAVVRRIWCPARVWGPGWMSDRRFFGPQGSFMERKHVQTELRRGQHSIGDRSGDTTRHCNLPAVW